MKSLHSAIVGKPRKTLRDMNAKFILLMTAAVFIPLLLWSQQPPRTSLRQPVSETEAQALAGSCRQQAKAEQGKGHLLGAISLYQQSLRVMDQVVSPTPAFRSEKFHIQTAMLSLTDTLLNQYGNAASRMLLLRFLMPVYEQTISTAFDLYESGHAMNYLESAFLLSEQCRNRVLTEAIRSSGLKAFRDVPPSMISQYWQWRASVFVYRDLVDAESGKVHPDPGLLRCYNDSLLFSQQRMDSLNFFVSRKYPSWYHLISSPGFATVQSVRKKLEGTGRAVLEYFCGDNALYLFCITEQETGFYRIRRDSLLNEISETFPATVLSSDRALFARQSACLWKKLVGPAEKLLTGCQRILVIHHGFTATIPFEALLCSPAGPGEGYDSYDYAIRHYCFSYAPSATLWLESRSAVPGESFTMVGFAPVFSMEMKNHYSRSCTEDCDSAYLMLPEQRWSQRFATEATEIIPGKWFIGEQATVNNFMMNAGNAGMIHLATHTVFDETDPLNSRIYLAKVPGDTSRTNGRIRAGDLFNMRINASLAILGSCRTGSGTHSRGEGMISLAYAFNYAGCNSLVYSLWNVDDKATAELMRYFYEGLRDGLPKDEALHQAKLKMLDEAGEMTANPYYWAGFVYSGDPVPLTGKHEKYPGFFLIAAITAGVLLMIFLLFLRNTRKKTLKS